MAELNEIVLENQKTGNPKSEWGLNSGASLTIEGFSTDISADIGERVDFKINTDAANYRIDIYRIGSYGGDGARKVASIEHNSEEAIHQPQPLIDLPTGMTADAGNWQVTDSWEVPDDAVSGVYIAKLVREDGIAGENHIPFVIRDDDGGSDVVFQTSDTTWQAYNLWGGTSLYGSSDGGGFVERAYAVSYNRPVQTEGINAVLGVEFAAIQFLEANGFDVSYISGVDTARSGDELLEHDLFLSVGHDEYWSGEQRDNVEAARDAGVNLAFWSGNEAYWKTRWEASIDDSGTPYRTLVSYKESYGRVPNCSCQTPGPTNPSTGMDVAGALAALRAWRYSTEAGTVVDPSDEWTGWFRDDPTAPGGADPENSLTGQLFEVNAYQEDTILVSDAFSDLRFWANTRVADLKPGETTELAPGTLGYEWDINPDNGFRPAGLIKLSSTKILTDEYTNNTGDPPYVYTAEAEHNLTLYRAPSGALVFGAGTVFWSWALDSHNPKGWQVDPAVQQAMINLLADMGIQPSTLQSGLVQATQSTDREAPTTLFTGSKFAGSNVALVGREIDLFGQSVDPGGGIVAGVEISVGGGIWQYASGAGDWSFSWTPTEAGSFQVQARAIDDNVNLGDVTELTVNVYDNLITGTSVRDLVLSVGASFAKGSAAAEGKVRIRHSTSDDDAIFSKGGKDTIQGLEGDDRINGGAGSDKVVGGIGQDVLIGAGGHDIFKFRAAIESTAAAPDLITDFQSGRDKIDLRGMAIADGRFIGDTDFSATAGELRFDSTQRLLEGDLDGDGVADFAVKLAAGHIATHDLLF